MGRGEEGVTWALRDVTRDSTHLLRTIFRSLYPTIRSGVENMHEMLPLTHGRRVAIQMWSAPRVESSRPGASASGSDRAPSSTRAASARASSREGGLQPRPTGRYALASRPCIPHRFACEGQQPGWARAQREAFAAAHGYGGPEEGVAVPPVVPPQSRHMREARVWPATI